MSARSILTNLSKITLTNVQNKMKISIVANSVFTFAFFFAALSLTPNCVAMQETSKTGDAKTDQESESDLSVIQQLEKFLADSELNGLSEAEFADTPLTKEEFAKAKELVWASHKSSVRENREEEWTNKTIEMDGHSMPFDFKVFGEKPENGRSLFISMHGGGGTAKRTNDGQWRNQITLYTPEEGVYLAPRAPTDSWNMWHRDHIDPMFARIISDAIVFEDVDPNRIYIMGYSAGGDGVYQLAPRMADQLAAAAMMAGHPNGANPIGLRNIGFTLHMGGKDRAYKRNEIARKWKTRLAELAEADPDGYKHEVTIHEQHGHWMRKDDAVAVPWMSEFTRNPFPEKVVWAQFGVKHDRFYWVAVNDENMEAGTTVVATRKGQNISIEEAEGLSELTIRFNDEMVDLDQPVTITMGEKELFSGELERNIKTLADTLLDRGDPAAVYSAEVEVKIDAS